MASVPLGPFKSYYPYRTEKDTKRWIVALEQVEHQSRIGGILNVRMQDSDSDDSYYRDPMSNDYDEGGSSSGGVANKEMGNVPPTT